MTAGNLHNPFCTFQKQLHVKSGSGATAYRTVHDDEVGLAFAERTEGSLCITFSP